MGKVRTLRGTINFIVILKNMNPVKVKADNVKDALEKVRAKYGDDTIMEIYQEVRKYE